MTRFGLASNCLSGATGRVTITNVDAASIVCPLQLQRLAPFDYILIDAPCTSVAGPRGEAI